MKQMTKQNKTQKYFNRTYRMTPYDARVVGTFDEEPRIKVVARPLTADEVRANNNAAIEVGRLIGDVRRWKPVFEEDLRRMNEHKNGRPYEYSDALIVWMNAVMTMFDGKFRITAGFLQAVLEGYGIPAPSPSRLLERANELAEQYMLQPDEDVQERYGESVYFAGVSSNVIGRVRDCSIDSSGLALSSINRWRKKKWRTEPKDKGWLEIHALCDVDTGEFISYAITDQTVGDAPLFKMLVRMAADGGHRIRKVYGDNAYCSDDNWRFMSDAEIEFITSFKVNTTPTSNGCLARGRAAKNWCEKSFQQWRKETGYGRRWKSECSFSDFKRLFPETVTARSYRGVVRQTMGRTDYYNLFKETRARIMKVTGNGVRID